MKPLHAVIVVAVGFVGCGVGDLDVHSGEAQGQVGSALDAQCSRYALSAVLTDTGMTTGVAKAQVVNPTDCATTVTFVSYKMYYAPHTNADLWLTTQTVFDHVTVSVPAHSTVDGSVFRVAVPDCLYQLDVYEGPVLDLSQPLPSDLALYTWAWSQKAVCTQALVQGCSPGYWKQEHHFDSYVGYTPQTRFKDAFGGSTAFGELTLSEVLNLRGGSLTALGRIMVGALLNASAIPGYPYTPVQVVHAFNSVTPDTLATVHAKFEALQDPCPLN